MLNLKEQSLKSIGKIRRLHFFTLQIERIQNPSLYQQYAAKKAHIEKHVDQNNQTLEMELWHGAAPKAIVSINYYGFNRSYCGNTGQEIFSLSFFLIFSYEYDRYQKFYLPNLIPGSKLLLSFKVHVA